MAKARILDRIRSPDDLKGLSREALHQLTEEVRQRVLEVVAKRGGHLGAPLGIATARDLAGEDFKVVTVTGDGAMTAGLAYEGLNNAGAAKSDLLVILNDNQMSIAPNVGAIHKYLTRVVTDPLYNRLKEEVWDLTGRIPRLSDEVRAVAHKLEEGVKGFLTPGLLFEELGFR